ncbi:MAG: site-2 protease family protein [Nitrosopumilus sp. B06]|nr:MAG: site-2 protease family protein [Nitrosopumilus sp. D6]RNJ80248.1 MAG: site-2 protease family protein [Nitrosopumilus sp. B06]
MEPSQDEIISLVTSTFEVSDVTKAEFSLEFRIEDAEFKEKFVRLARRLEDESYVCRLEQVGEFRYIIIQKFVKSEQNRWFWSAWMPRLLFAVVILFVMIDGYYRAEGINTLALKVPGIKTVDPFGTAAIYTASLLGTLGVHELGHIIAARAHGLKTSWPYFIPGLPIIGIPTFGAFIQSRGLTINREILFDVAIAGPVAGLAIAIIVSVYGASEAQTLEIVDMDPDKESQLSEWDQGEPLLMTASLALFGKGGPGHVVILSPVMFAAWIGFLITFLNMLPAWQLDGGHMARTLLGANMHKYATYASMGVLFLLGYHIMAVLILVMSMRSPSASPLDNVSPLTRNRKFAYAGIIALAILCAPLPSWITS